MNTQLYCLNFNTSSGTVGYSGMSNYLQIYIYIHEEAFLVFSDLYGNCHRNIYGRLWVGLLV